MAKNPNILIRFWQELRRRKVFKVVAMYAGSAFVIIQVVDILTAPLGLPSWIVTLAVILLSIGFLVVAVLAWIFDLTPQGIMKTESLEESAGKEIVAAPERRRMKTSDIVIAVLAIAVIVLAYREIFKLDTLEKLRKSGERISIAVMPFENLTGDTTLNWFQRGISSLLINGLGSSSELAVLDDQTMYEAMERMHQVYTAAISPLQAKKLSEKAKTETYISGSFQGTEGKYKILANLVDTKSGEIICTKMAEGDLKSPVYLDLADSLCNEIKDHLEIKVLERKTDYDFREAFPSSAEAYRYFVEGVNLLLNSDYEAATKSIEKSLKIDSTFTFASFYLAFANSFNDQYEQAVFWTQKAYKSKEKLPVKYQNWLEMWYAFYLSKNKQDILYYCNLLEKSGIESRLLWFDLGCTYREVLQQFDRSVKAFKKIEEINAEKHSDWKYIRYYEEFCQSLLNNNMPEEAIKISAKGLNLNPENVFLIIYKGSGYCMLRDSLSLNKVIHDIRSYITNNNESKSIEETYLGDIFRNAKDYVNAVKHYRRSYLLDPGKSLYLLFNYSQTLIEHEINVEDGLEISEIIIKNYPEIFWGIYLKGLAYHKMGRNVEALEVLKEADQKCQGYYAPLAEGIQEVENALTKNQ